MKLVLEEVSILIFTSFVRVERIELKVALHDIFRDVA